MYINNKKLIDISNSQVSEPLDSETEIEDVLVLSKEIDRKIDFLSKLKKDRTQKIQEEIDKLEIKKRLFKEVIEATLSKFNYKSLNFPGIGRVTSKTIKGKWIIKDETKLLDFLKKELSEDQYKKVVVLEESIVKKALLSYLEDFERVGRIPECVSKDKDDKSITISYDEEIATKIAEADNSNAEVKESKDVLNSGYDKVDF
jgi:hypothetical protein